MTFLYLIVLENPTGTRTRSVGSPVRFVKNRNKIMVSTLRSITQICTQRIQDSKPTVEITRAVTRGQQQKEATAQLKSNQFLLENWEPSNVRERQLTDPIISPIMVAVETQSRPDWKNISETTSYTKTHCRQWDRLSIISGILYRKWVSDELRNTKYQLIVPKPYNKTY